MIKYTSIRILPETRKMLDSLKHSREGYDEPIKKLVELIPRGDEEGEYSNNFRAGLLNAKIDVIQNRTYPTSKVIRKKNVYKNK